MIIFTEQEIQVLPVLPVVLLVEAAANEME